MSLDYWEQRYQTKDMPWEKGEPSPGLVDFLATHRGLPGETVCVPGGGTGHDACEWAKAGFRVYGYDIAPSAVQLSATRAQAANLRAEFRRADFLRDDPPFAFDWIFEHTLFCAIQPGERDLYRRAVIRWLKPGGNYLAVNYLIADTDGPPFGTTREPRPQTCGQNFAGRISCGTIRRLPSIGYSSTRCSVRFNRANAICIGGR